MGAVDGRAPRMGAVGGRDCKGGGGAIVAAWGRAACGGGGGGARTGSGGPPAGGGGGRWRGRRGRSSAPDRPARDLAPACRPCGLRRRARRRRGRAPAP